MSLSKREREREEKREVHTKQMHKQLGTCKNASDKSEDTITMDRE